MGVLGLMKYARTQPNVSDCKNVLEEIEKFKKYEKNPLIVFDIMGFVHIFGKSNMELKLGGRHVVYLRQFESFLDELKRAGALLLFCCDGQLQDVKIDEWCLRREDEHKQSIKILTDSNGSARVDGPKHRRFACKSLMNDLMKTIADNQYGEIVISTEMDCDTIVANYALSQNALAVIASDSDYFIFDGDFQLWEVGSLKLETFSVQSFDRKLLREQFGLSSDQMKILAAIKGNDHTRQLRPKNAHEKSFTAIAKFCRSIEHEFNDELYKEIAKFINDDVDKCETKLKNYVNAIEKSIKLYDVNFELPTNVDKLTQYYTSNVLMYALLTQKVFQYEMNFIDFGRCNKNDSKHFVDAVLDVFRKLGGILLANRNGEADVTLKIVTKYSLADGYVLKNHLPIYPEKEDFFELEDLIFGPAVSFDCMRWNLLLWSLDINPQFRFHLENIPPEYTTIVLALTFLVKSGEMSERQADALLISQYDIIEKYVNVDEIAYAKGVSAETIRTGQLYNRGLTLIADCLTVCGLKKHIHFNTYDGFYYAEMTQQFRHSDALYRETIKHIQSCRLYKAIYWK